MDLTHFPALQIIIPLMAAPLCVALRNGRLAWLIALVANAAVVFVAACLLQKTMSGSAIRYALGGWAAPTGIEYYIDALNASVLLLVTIISLLALLYSYKSAYHEIKPQRLYLFYAGWLLCLTGLLGIVITGDIFNVFVFLEISSLSTYMLIALGQDRKHALIAAFRYLIIGSIGASFILIGIGFLYAATGTLNMFDMADRLQNIDNNRTVLVAFTFLSMGVMIKAAIFPLHAWLPNAYNYAPAAAAVFLAGTATKVSVYVLLRFFFNVFTPEYSFGQMLLAYVLLPLSVFGFLAMSMVAIFQSDIRRMLAYSSVAQIAYIIAAICMTTVDGLTAGILHIFNHAFIKAALFMCVGCIIYRIGSTKIHDMAGLFRQMPYTCSAFIIAGLSLIGVPLTAGFVSKWNLLQAAMTKGWWLLAVMMLLSSLMAIIYIGRVIEVIYFRDTNKEHVAIKEAPLQMLIPMWIMVAACIYLGINGNVTVDIASTAAQQLLGGF